MVRRGSISPMYEMIIGLLLIGIFLLAVYPYIFERANGELYFSRFYTVDLATSADIVNAGYGDVVLRYDNLKQNLDLTFFFDNGIVLARQLPDPARAHEIFSSPELIKDGQFYGRAKEYHGGAVVFDRPAFLVMRKADGVFAVTEAETSLKECAAVVPVVPRTDALVSINVEGPGAERIEARARQILQSFNLKSAENGNVRINVIWKNGPANRIETLPTSADGRAYACLFDKRLQAITLIDFASNDPSSSGTAFDVSITLESASAVTEEQIAQAIANALVVYYK